MDFYVLRIENQKRFVICENLDDSIIEWLMKKPFFNRALDMCQVTDKKFAIRLRAKRSHGKRPEIKNVDILTYTEYCKHFKNEIENSKPCFNRANAWKYFYPEGHGKPKKGYALHHKDESLRHGNPARYHMWLPEDLVMMTRSEHQRHHVKGRMMSEDTRKKCGKHMLGNTNNRGKHWFNNGTVNVRTFEAPEGFVSGLIRKKK